jgi:hypothetical protein
VSLDARLSARIGFHAHLSQSGDINNSVSGSLHPRGDALRRTRTVLTLEHGTRLVPVLRGELFTIVSVKLSLNF